MSEPMIPGVRNAKLPAVYVEAQKALAACQKIDECKAWADKAAAIASYAKQAQDQTLMDTATRIKARAIRRCGEILKEMKKSQGERTDRPKGGAPPRSRRARAQAAGLSRDQERDAGIQRYTRRSRHLGCAGLHQVTLAGARHGISARHY